MNLQDVSALAVATVAAIYVCRSLYRNLSARGGCHCSRANSPSPDERAPAVVKRLPLVSIDQIGKPCEEQEQEAKS